VDSATNDSTTSKKLHAILLQLARAQEALAATEAMATPYWEASPSSVIGHRAAAAVLRAEANRLAAAS
jgi:hypothetical protein